MASKRKWYAKNRTGWKRIKEDSDGFIFWSKSCGALDLIVERKEKKCWRVIVSINPGSLEDYVEFTCYGSLKYAKEVADDEATKVLLDCIKHYERK